jgi:hypothetical protein
MIYATGFAVLILAVMGLVAVWNFRCSHCGAWNTQYTIWMKPTGEEPHFFTMCERCRHTYKTYSEDFMKGTP